MRSLVASVDGHYDLRVVPCENIVHAPVNTLVKMFSRRARRDTPWFSVRVRVFMAFRNPFGARFSVRDFVFSWRASCFQQFSPFRS